MTHHALTPRGRGPISTLAICAFLCAAMSAVALPAWAQGFGAATDGVRFPLESTTLSDGVRGLEINPAGLGFVDTLDVQLLYTHLQAGGPGSGFAAMTGLRLFGGLRVGLDAQYLNDGYGKLGFGLALSPSDTFSFGYSFHGLVARDGEPQDGVTTMDLGFVLRPVEWVSLAAAVRDLTAPDVGRMQGERAWEVGAAFRPGTWRLSIGAELAIAEQSGHVDPSAVLVATPFDGFRLGAQARFWPRDGELGFELAASLGIDWSMLSGEVGAFVGQPAGADLDYDGISVGLRITNQPRLSIHRAHDVWVDVTLSSPSERPTRTWLGGGGPTQLGTLTYLSRLAADEHVSGVLLRYDGLGVSWAQARELRAAIASLRQAGKKVAVYFDVTDTVGYYIASAADYVLVDPAGGIWLIGLASRVTYFADFFSWIGVKAQFAKHGKYKSFPEAYTESGSTDASREVREALLDGLLDEVLSGLSEGRKVSKDAARAWIDAGPFTSAGAVQAHLADRAVFSADVNKALEEEMGRPVALRKGYVPENPRWEHWGEPDCVAVLTVDGSIVDGKSGNIPFLVGRTIGDESFAALVDGVMADARVRAIVVRIDSPGGSALASDKMYRKLREARSKKPVVVSMGSMAASGGYYLAVASERIFAEPSTITGSIGTFLGKFSVAELFGKLGLHTEVWKRGKNADLFLFEVPWTDDQLTEIQEKLGFYYEQFLGVVAAERGMSRDAVHEVAQGRVWLGRDAVDKGLVDELGGLQEAVTYAAGRAGFEPDLPVPLIHLPQRSALDALRDLLLPGASAFEDVGATAPEVSAPGDEAAGPPSDESWVMQALGAALGPVAALLPYADGQPLFLLPFSVEWTTHWGAGGRASGKN